MHIANSVQYDQSARPLDAFVNDLHQKKKFRPTAVAVVEDRLGRLLFLKSVQSGRWGFLQGGIEPFENVAEALAREMLEEASITPDQVRSSSHYLVHSLAGHGVIHDGYPDGVCYLYHHVGYCGPAEIVMQRTEISEYRWLSHADAVRFVNDFTDLGYGKKRASLLQALAHLPKAL